MAKPVRSVKLTAAQAKKLNAAVDLLANHVNKLDWTQLTQAQKTFLLDNSPVLKRMYDLTRDLHAAQPYQPGPPPAADGVP